MQPWPLVKKNRSFVLFQVISLTFDTKHMYKRLGFTTAMLNAQRTGRYIIYCTA